jgi:hypothetical protein
MMTTVFINDKYISILSRFGDLQEAVDIALRRYTIDQITDKITELRQKDVGYQTKYKLDYTAFAQQVADDETFVTEVETNTDKMWENDLADWEFCHKRIENWTRTLENILLK